MDYAKVVKGEVVEIGPEPSAWTNPDGSSFSSSEDTPTDPAILKKAGYLPVEDRYEQEVPGAAPQEYGEPELEVLKTKVVRHFRLQDLPEPEADPVASRFVDYDQRLMNMEAITAHYKPIIDDWSQVGAVHEMDARALYGAYSVLRAEVAALRAEVAALRA